MSSLTSASAAIESADGLRQARRHALESALAGQPDPLSRRRFLELLGASLALAGAAGCAPPRDQIVPYVRPPADVNSASGKPLYFATAHVMGGFADGLLVESSLGRPTKVEGNPQHPSSLGGTDAYAQASLLNLYDPNRSQTLTYRGGIRTWPDFLRDVRAALAQLQSTSGQGLRFLSESVTSPTLAAQLQQIMTAFPRAGWHRWQSIHRDNSRAGVIQAFGEPLEVRYRFDTADVVLTLDADPFDASQPGHVRYIRDFAARRQPERGPLNRVYAIESTQTSVGALADHRLSVRAQTIESVAWSLAAGMGLPVAPPSVVSVPSDWLQAVADDLRNHPGASVVIAGETQPPAVHALVHAINSTLGNVGHTVEYTDPIEVDPADARTSFRELADDMAAGEVQLLVILGGNPAYTAPLDIPFATNLRNVGLIVQLGMYDDETAALSHWHIPELHPLETWSDARAFDGTATILQPLIQPLYQGWSKHELLAAFGDQPDTPSHNAVKSTWQQRLGQSGDFEPTWRRLLHDGLVPDTAAPPRQVNLRADWSAGLSPFAPAAPDALELSFRSDPSVYDGRFAGNGWLMELPKPFTRLTWDNVAHFSPSTASQLGVTNGDVVELRYGGHALRAPAWILPGQADGSVMVTLGYGRRRGAGAGNGVGFDANALRTSTTPWFDAGLEVVRTGDKYPLASTQGSYSMEGRDLVRTSSSSAVGSSVTGTRPRESLYPDVSYPTNAWGMVIDQSACVGCNACIVACQAENNSPIVGKEEVRRGRDMHWLRLDTYYEGDRALRQLVPCMQCENAPCELVCPVGATVHSDEGLNDMVYNRCVGTRYCSNNCPYKVRHFNFFEYADFQTPELKLLRNPQVTVRSRGVMEKCTYCVQRITAARIQAEEENRPIADGEVVTACQAACPANAIVFGNLNDPATAVTRARASSRNYTLLEELNTRPRTTYQSIVRNPNPALGEP